MGPHLFQGKQLLLVDGLDDGAFTHAVATADLGAVGHGHDGAAAAVAGITHVRLPE